VGYTWSRGGSVSSAVDPALVCIVHACQLCGGASVILHAAATLSSCRLPLCTPQPRYVMLLPHHAAYRTSLPHYRDIPHPYITPLRHTIPLPLPHRTPHVHIPPLLVRAPELRTLYHTGVPIGVHMCYHWFLHLL
jgi:hypothetical protein